MQPRDLSTRKRDDRRSKWLSIAFAMVLAVALLLGSGVLHRVLSAVIITATKTDMLSIDADSNSVPSPGDTLFYQITIQNTGDADATNAVFNDTIDNNTTFVPNSLDTTPLARNDSYSTVGNVQLSVPAASGVLANDSDPDGSGGLSVVSSDPFSLLGGSVNALADGSFTYDPTTGFSGTDTFNYIATDGEGNNNNATVSIDVGPVVWFIDNSAAGPGNGRFTSPFSSIANFNTLAGDNPGDYIFVYQGSGAYSDAITLLNSEQLIGQGVGLSLSPNLNIPATSRPTLTSLSLVSNNTVRGLNISTNTGTAVSGANVGVLTISDVSVTNSGGVGVSLSGGNFMDVTFDSVSSSGGANGIVLTNNGGYFTVNGGTIDPTTGHGIQVSNTGAGLNFYLQNSTITGAPVGFNGINFEIPTSGSFGTIDIFGNTIVNNGSSGVRANIQGTGSIGNINIEHNTFSNNDTGVDLATNGTANVNFTIQNNGTMNGTRTQVNIAANDLTANDGVGPTMTGYIRNNTITTSPAGSVYIGMWVVAEGDGTITTDINNNTIANFGESGIAVESRGGTGVVNARIADNSTATTASFPLDGLFLRAGNGTAGETNRLCVNLGSNNMNGGGSAVADYYLDRFNPATTVFQLQGLSPSPATPLQTGSFVISTDSAPPATAYVETGTYTAATCATVPFAMAPTSGPMVAQATEPATPEMVEPAAPQAEAAPTFITPGGYHGLASPLLAPLSPVNLGTLNPSEQITITFQVTINSGFTGSQVCNQGNITADGGINIPTNDPDTGTPNDATCTPVTLLPGKLTLVKKVINDDGGLAGPNDFGLAIDGSPVDSGQAVEVAAGQSVTINETGLSGYRFVSITGDVQCPAVLGGSIIVGAGDDIHCTITNDDIASTITVNKVVIPVSDTGVFSLTIDSVTHGVGGDGTSTGAIPVISGTHTIAELGANGTNLAGYNTQIGGDCAANGTVTVGLAETTTCTITNSLSAAPGENSLYLPLIIKDFIIAPDLIITDLQASSNAVTVTIRNAGDTSVVDAFWVDVYFNPGKVPGLNEPWSTIAGQGIAWGLAGSDLPIEPGQTRVLTLATAVPGAGLTSPPPYPAGATVYALVDSVDFSTSYGAVQEINESNNLAQSTVTAAGTGPTAQPAVTGQSSPPAALPRRR